MLTFQTIRLKLLVLGKAEERLERKDPKIQGSFNFRNLKQSYYSFCAKGSTSKISFRLRLFRIL